MKILLGKNRLNGTAIENEGQFAEGTPAIRKEEDDIVLIQNKSEKPEIMFEDVSLRDSHIKHYRMTDGPFHNFAALCTGHCSTCVAQAIRGMMI